MGKYLATVRPNLDGTNTTTAYAQHDLLFDWSRFEIPKGEACIKSMNIIWPGTNGTAGNAHDLTFFIARAVNGAAPPSLGTVNSVMNSGGAGAAKIGFAGSRNHIVYTRVVDVSAMATAATYIQGYSILTDSLMNTIGGVQSPAMDASAAQPHFVNALQPGGVFIGNSTYAGNYNDSTSEPGMQSFWIAAITNGAVDFGTGITLNQAGDQAAVAKSTTSETTLTVADVDADDILCVGDDLIAGNDGALIGKVTEVTSATSIKVDHVAEALEDDDEICIRNPIIFNFGIEY